MRFARKDFATLNQNLTIGQALASIRQRGVGEKIVYFYVVDDAEQLVGVVPTRRLLMAALELPLAEFRPPGHDIEANGRNGNGAHPHTVG